MTPSLDHAAGDTSDAYRGDGHHPDCFSHPPVFAPVTCEFADRSGSTRVALVGNSHAGEWLPAMQQVASAHRWRLTTYLASQCAFADVAQNFAGSARQGCTDWVHATTRSLARGHFGLVVLENRTSVTAVGAHGTAANLRRYQAGFADALRELHAAHLHVLVIHDTPAPVTLIPTCLKAHRTNYAACNGRRSVWLAPDPAVAAVDAEHLSQVSAVDLSDRICGPTICAAVVGGVVVYKDGSHLTATYDRMLSTYLAPHLTAALG